jgi:hypothetical protein
MISNRLGRQPNFPQISSPQPSTSTKLSFFTRPFKQFWQGEKLFSKAIPAHFEQTYPLTVYILFQKSNKGSSYSDQP